MHLHTYVYTHPYVYMYIHIYVCVCVYRVHARACKSETNITIIDKVKMLKREQMYMDIDSGVRPHRSRKTRATRRGR